MSRAQISHSNTLWNGIVCYWNSKMSCTQLGYIEFNGIAFFESKKKTKRIIKLKLAPFHALSWHYFGLRPLCMMGIYNLLLFLFFYFMYGIYITWMWTICMPMSLWVCVWVCGMIGQAALATNNWTHCRPNRAAEYIYLNIYIQYYRGFHVHNSNRSQQIIYTEAQWTVWITSCMLQTVVCIRSHTPNSYNTPAHYRKLCCIYILKICGIK